ncbi:MAG: hypothetical protein AAF357_01285 [Verrucomicrobiota bacterium]
MKYLASSLSDETGVALRQHLFTPWMGPAALQDHVDHMVDLGMLPLYTEYEPDQGFREIYWTPQVRTYFEARSARDEGEFQEVVDRNRREGNCLATLHISSDGLYSSTWLGAEAHSSAERLLSQLGISQAEIL